jgi:hypothetical protein
MNLYIWVTFHSSTSLQIAGLRKVYIWFSEPNWVEYKRNLEDDMQGLTPYGWMVISTGHNETKSVSCGKVFGYESNISRLIWDNLCSFFGSSNLEDWDSTVEGKTPDKFLLKLNLKHLLV